MLNDESKYMLLGNKDENEIINAVRRLKNSKVAGIDSITEQY